MREIDNDSSNYNNNFNNNYTDYFFNNCLFPNTQSLMAFLFTLGSMIMIFSKKT
jgi:hypothetical protein